MLKKMLISISLLTLTAQATELKKGPNHLQPAPVLTSATTNGSKTFVRGTFCTKTAGKYIIQFFNNSQNNNPITEGDLFLGQIKIKAKAGENDFKACLPCTNARSFISATATRVEHNELTDTSMFSLNVEVQ